MSTEYSTRMSPDVESDLTGDTELARRVIEGDDAAGDILYEKYNRLVAHIARKSISQLHNGSVDEDDLIQAGWEHALVSLHRFHDKEEANSSLKTYMTNFMREVLAQTVDSQYAIRIPSGRSQMARTVMAINHRHMQDNRSIMSDDEIASLLDIPLGPTTPTDDKGKEFTVGDIHLIIRETRMMGSIDTGFNPHADFSQGDPYTLDEISHMKPLTESETKTVEDEAIAIDQAAWVRKQLNEAFSTKQGAQSNNEVMRRTLELRSGLETGQPLTLEGTGKILGFTKERIRQFEARAITILRIHMASQ